MNNDTPADAMKTLEKMLASRRQQLASCERMLELLQPEWDRFEAKAGHDIYVARDYAEHTSAARTHRKEISALEYATAPSLAAQDGLVEALRYARSQIVGLAVSGTDRIDELCRKLQQLDPSPIWPIPFPDPPERTWQPIVKKIDAALASIEVKS